ncbi:MAG: hypothetical protein KF886_14610 [Candidatus Hydrogenedentes bacterium]|nr:hypothetical protein [Candidatus Hydrogenedentota bacterium]
MTKTTMRVHPDWADPTALGVASWKIPPSVQGAAAQAATGYGCDNWRTPEQNEQNYPGIGGKGCITHISSSSYPYWGYAIQAKDVDTPGAMRAFGAVMDAWPEVAAECGNQNQYLTIGRLGGSFTVNLACIGRPAVSLPSLREGIERFMITDINNPGASAKAQSEVAVMWDSLRGGEDIETGWDPATTVASLEGGDFNHVPGGANVLFMDGHVEFAKYPQPNGSKAYTATQAALFDGSFWFP